METRQAGQPMTREKLEERRTHYAETLPTIEARAAAAKDGTKEKAALEKDVARRKRALGQIERQLAESDPPS